MNRWQEAGECVGRYSSLPCKLPTLSSFEETPTILILLCAYLEKLSGLGRWGVSAALAGLQWYTLDRRLKKFEK